MGYTTLEAVKLYLGITGTSQDIILLQLIKDAEIYIHKELDIDGFNFATKNEKIRFNRQSYRSIGHYTIPLKNFNVLEILEINNKPYTGIEGVDYHISNNRVLNIRNLHQYFTPIYFNYCRIKYTYGRERTPVDMLPSDIELMTRLLAIGLYNEKYPMGYGATIGGIISSDNITSYKLGDESISWAKSGIGSIVSWKDKSQRDMFAQLFIQYKKAPNVIQ